MSNHDAVVRAQAMAEELESWELVQLSEGELAEARELGVFIPSPDLQQILPAVRAVVRQDIAERRTLALHFSAQIDRGLEEKC